MHIDILSYLNSLSHIELLDLCIRLVNDNESAKNILLQKINDSEIERNLQPKNNFSESSKTSTPTENANLLTHTSTSQEKINLFKSLFAGRNDVFALRWHNQKTNKSGYSPVCANKWQSGKCDLKKYSCASCPFKSPVPLSDSYIFAHLLGKDELARDVLAI